MQRSATVRKGVLQRSLGLLAACVLLAASGASSVFAQVRPDRGAEAQHSVLGLRTGQVDTSRAEVSLTDLAASAKRAEKTRAVVQLSGPMDDARSARLEDAGVRLGTYLPPNAYVVDLSGADEAKLRTLDFVRWQGVYEREWKLDNEIGQRPYVTPERQEELRLGMVSVVVHLFDEADLPSVVDAIGAIPGSRVVGAESVDGIATVSATMKFNDTVLLADLAEVQFVEDAPENTLRSNTADRWIVQSNVLNVTPVYANGITGVGQIVGVIDGALDMNHCSFRDSVNNTPGPAHRKVLAYNTTQGAASHGTHVSGTIAGDAGLDDNTRGVAYGSKIVYNSIPSPQDEANITAKLNLHYGQGARIHTNSWGDDGTTLYTGQCRGIDAHTYANEDSLVLFAVTNTSTLKTPENAKNCLAVGASGGAGSQDVFCSGGTGPTSDGRRKPEVFAPGCSTVSSSANTACGTTSLTGTSMACPAVAGAATLVREYYARGYYPSGAANVSDGFNPSAALVKATVLNSAVDMTGIAGYPSNQEGWGRVLLDNALFFVGDARKLYARDVRNIDGLTTGATFEQGVNVVGGGMPFEVTIAWTDPPAAVNANPAYINNLDLEVVGPGGEMYRGNNFVSGQSAQGGAADFRNNVETVLLNAPAPGTYLVRVRATAVNVGAQGYALVMTGDMTLGPAPLSVSVSGVPSLVLPGTPTSFTVTVNPGDDALVPGSAMLFHRSNPMDTYTAANLVPIGGNQFTANLPGFLCGTTPQFYVSAAGAMTGTVTSPFNGAANPMTFTLGEVVVVLDDPIETPTGWTVGAVGDTATTGIWEMVDPIGTTYQPEDDHSPVGTMCWITGQHTVGQTAGFNDVDNGATTLTSPIFDLSGIESPTISYWRWFFGTAPSDVFTVSLSNNGGTSWTVVETLPGGNTGWNQFSFLPANIMPLTSQMRLRFVADDGGAGTFVEAGVDDLYISAFRCENPAPPECPGDADGSGVVDFSDITAVLSGWGTTGPLGDANHDGLVNFKDITSVLANFGMVCPTRGIGFVPTTDAE
ncbi:MAG: S8 family serine peptidase [Phycisphaerae bacterium]|nr:S8 family serine peptidase [Phycisphaerae bacterium]